MDQHIPGFVRAWSADQTLRPSFFYMRNANTGRRRLSEEPRRVFRAWFDCGGHKEYGEFLKEYLPICSGYVLLHYTYYRGKPNPNYTEIETYVSNEEWERIDMIEPHKYRQGSFTMIKRRT